MVDEHKQANAKRLKSKPSYVRNASHISSILENVIAHEEEELESAVSSDNVDSERKSIHIPLLKSDFYSELVERTMMSI